MFCRLQILLILLATVYVYGWYDRCGKFGKHRPECRKYRQSYLYRDQYWSTDEELSDYDEESERTSLLRLLRLAKSS